MLSAAEFTVGTLADAKPLSLMLPRYGHEGTFLIGQTENGPMAVCIGGGRFNFHFFECRDNTHRKGLLIPDVRIEVDETSLFDPDRLSAHLGTVIRIDTRVVVSVTNERFFGDSRVTLEADLPLAHDLSAAFSKWHIVIGEGRNRRVLRKIDTGQRFMS